MIKGKRIAIIGAGYCCNKALKSFIVQAKRHEKDLIKVVSDTDRLVQSMGDLGIEASKSGESLQKLAVQIKNLKSKKHTHKRKSSRQI